MSTKKLYLASHDLAGNATVVAILNENKTIRLDQTLFHPQGGGQKADKGTIAGQDVVGVRHAEEGWVDHHLNDPATFSVGDEVTMTVDQATRFENMCLHSSGHLISDAMASIRPTIVAVQGHHWPREARVEFEGTGLDEEGLAGLLQTRVDQLISDEIPMEIVGDPFSSRALKIGDYEPVGCGGTHVDNTRSLAGLTIGKTKLKKGRLRISYGLSTAS